VEILVILVEELLPLNMSFSQSIIITAHRSTSKHRQEIIQSDKCGCFYCFTTFRPMEILEWVDDDTTALCPNCGIDSVIGDKSGYPATDVEFLKQMHFQWF
jgi:hypothetical protein